MDITIDISNLDQNVLASLPPSEREYIEATFRILSTPIQIETDAPYEYVGYPIFSEYMRQIDLLLLYTCGLSSADLPDVCYMDWYEDRLNYVHAANRALAYAQDMPEPDIFTPDDIIYSYTRKQALSDGVQVDANGPLFGEVSRQHYKYRVYMTEALFNLIERAVNNTALANDWLGVWHDICFMSIHKQVKHVGGIYDDTVYFQVLIMGADDDQDLYTLKAVCAPTDIDDPKPCVTFMLEDED